MPETLAVLFQKSKAAVIEYNNQLVHGILNLKINGSQKFIIRRLNSSKSLLQGLRLKAVKGSIEVNGQSHGDIILWADTCPEAVDIYVASKSECELKIWNVWKSGEITHAWIGNAGFLVFEKENIIMLECSDGVGEVDFSDLVIEIEKIPEG